MFRIAAAVRQNGKNVKGPTKRRGVSMAKGLTASNQTFSAQKLYFNLVQYMEVVGRRVEQGKHFDMREGRNLLEFLLRTADTVILELKKISLLSTHHSHLSIHAVNATIQAIPMGGYFNYEYQEMLDLATAALFHEIGMHTLPPGIREKEGKFTDEEYKKMLGHCEAGYQLIRQCGSEYDGIAEIVRQEHERYDGSGYPRKLKGDEIHEHAMIIGIVDMYVSMIHDRSYRRRLLPAEAMKQIITNCKGIFPS